ncbi:hypothetical protein MKZ38_002472 [Zalerion maritima]|uniref:Uncharacterized protein n=1 Tax=Zalerion maritima TaxID=339359 RepID=A0AAD5RPV6_9PEZI|nr:hypothetical protein MKZ38_002472 [Zalerion maritima]
MPPSASLAQEGVALAGLRLGRSSSSRRDNNNASSPSTDSMMPIPTTSPRPSSLPPRLRSTGSFVGLSGGYNPGSSPLAPGCRRPTKQIWKASSFKRQESPSSFSSSFFSSSSPPTPAASSRSGARNDRDGDGTGEGDIETWDEVMVRCGSPIRSNGDRPAISFATMSASKDSKDAAPVGVGETRRCLLGGETNGELVRQKCSKKNTGDSCSSPVPPKHARCGEKPGYISSDMFIVISFIATLISGLILVVILAFDNRWLACEGIHRNLDPLYLWEYFGVSCRGAEKIRGEGHSS